MRPGVTALPHTGANSSAVVCQGFHDRQHGGQHRGAGAKPGHDRLYWFSQPCMDKRFSRRCLKARETEDMPLVTRTTRALEMDRRALTNSVSRGHVCT